MIVVEVGRRRECCLGMSCGAFVSQRFFHNLKIVTWIEPPLLLEF